MQLLWVTCNFWEGNPHKTPFECKETLCAVGEWRGANNIPSCSTACGCGSPSGCHGQGHHLHQGFCTMSYFQRFGKLLIS